MLAIPVHGFVSCCASMELLVVMQPASGKEVGAGITDYALVGQ